MNKIEALKVLSDTLIRILQTATEPGIHASAVWDAAIFIRRQMKDLLKESE